MGGDRLITTDSLTEQELAAVADLAQRCLAADGGRLKLEWQVLAGSEGSFHAALSRVDGVLQGFAASYLFPGSVPEITGMVAPAARGRGTGAALLDAVLAMSPGPQALLIVPRDSLPGARLARSRGGGLHHSEHAMRSDAPPAHPRPRPAGVQLRPLRAGEVPLLATLLSEGFGREAGAVPQTDPQQLAATRMVLLGDQPIGTLRLQVEADRTGIYGFVIAPQWRGHGIGSWVLDEVCRQAFRAGCREVHLEVETRNDRALRLYESMGLRRVGTEDYWSLRTPGAPDK